MNWRRRGVFSLALTAMVAALCGGVAHSEAALQPNAVSAAPLSSAEPLTWLEFHMFVLSVDSNALGNPADLGDLRPLQKVGYVADICASADGLDIAAGFGTSLYLDMVVPAQAGGVEDAIDGAESACQMSGVRGQAVLESARGWAAFVLTNNLIWHEAALGPDPPIPASAFTIPPLSLPPQELSIFCNGLGRVDDIVIDTIVDLASRLRLLPGGLEDVAGFALGLAIHECPAIGMSIIERLSPS